MNNGGWEALEFKPVHIEGENKDKPTRKRNYRNNNNLFKNMACKKKGKGGKKK